MDASMRPLLLLLLLPLLPLQCVLGTMASAASSTSLTPEDAERAAKKFFVQLGAHESLACCLGEDYANEAGRWRPG